MLTSELSRRRLLPLVILLMVLSGCTGFSPDGGFGAVEQGTRERIGKEVKWARSDDERQAIADRVRELLAGPLSADDAVQIALLNNRGLQAGFFELGISEAELVRAGSLPNPTFTMFHASRREGGVRDYKIEQVLTEANLAKITAGMDRADVQRLIGRPGSVMTYANSNEEVWDWRVAGTIPTEEAHFHAHFDPAGGLVTRTSRRIEPKG